MGILFYGIANVESAFSLDIPRLRTLPEGYAVYYVVRFVVYKLELYVLLLAANNLARAVIVNAAGAKKRFGITRPERIEFLQVVLELAGDVLEIYHGGYVETCLGLLVAYVLLHIFFETAFEFRHVIRLHGHAGSISVPAEVLKQVAATLHGLVYVESGH